MSVLNELHQVLSDQVDVVLADFDNSLFKQSILIVCNFITLTTNLVPLLLQGFVQMINDYICEVKVSLDAAESVNLCEKSLQLSLPHVSLQEE